MALKRAALAAWRYGCHRKGSLWRDGGKCFAFGRLHLFLTSITQMTGRSTPATLSFIGGGCPLSGWRTGCCHCCVPHLCVRTTPATHYPAEPMVISLGRPC